MIKKFESFSKSPSIEEAYNYLRLFGNHGEEEIEDFELLGDRFFDNTGYMLDLSQVTISKEDESNILTVYNNLINTYGEMPDYSKIEPLFLELMDIKVVEFDILLYKKCFCFSINTTPNIGEQTLSSKIKKEFDINIWDSITREVLPICNGIKDMGYKVKTHLGTYNNAIINGKISLLVSV